MDSVVKQKWICSVCEKTYVSKKVLKKHLKNIHKTSLPDESCPTSHSHLQCPDHSCQLVFAKKKDLCEHIEFVHKIKIELVEKTFPTYSGILLLKVILFGYLSSSIYHVSLHSIQAILKSNSFL